MSGRDRDERGRQMRDDDRRGPDFDREARSWDDERQRPWRSQDDTGQRDQYGQRRYGDGSGRGGFGPGGYGAARGAGGYGPQGYGSDPNRPGRGGTMPTYGDTTEDRLAQRSRWREDQRYGDHDSVGETWRRGEPRRDAEYGAVDRGRQYGAEHSNPDLDHEPHYRSWREQQLASHDRDYARWREQQARRYDDEYRTWRNQRHETFSRDFQDWRSRGAPEGESEAGQSSASPTGASASASATGMSGAATGARGAQTGHVGGATAWSDSGGGATGAAGVTGGAGGVSPQTFVLGSSTGAAQTGGAKGPYSDTDTKPASSAAPTGRSAADAGGPPISDPSVQSVTDGHSRTHGKDDDDDTKRDGDKRH